MQVLVKELNNGVLIPVVSLGTWQVNRDLENIDELITEALNSGYYGVDTAFIYNNEDVLGPLVANFNKQPKELKCEPTECSKVVSYDEFRKSFEIPHGVTVDDRRVFVTTKVWISGFTKEGIRNHVKEHLKNFSRSSIDLILLHWPGIEDSLQKWCKFSDEERKKLNTDSRRIECWRELEILYHEGVLRSIGVSNYMMKHLKPLIKDIEIRKAAGCQYAMMPQVNQIEITPFYQPSDELSDFCKKYNILLTSYSTLGGSNKVQERLQNPIIKKIADEVKQTPANVMLRWAIEKGYTILPKSVNLKRLKDNLNCQVFSLTEEHMKSLEKLNTHEISLIDPLLID